MKDYVTFCDILVCLCLIFELILHFGVGADLLFNIINFSQFFFLLTFDHGNVGICLCLILYVFRRGHLLPSLSLSSYFVHCFVANFSLLLCFHFIILLNYYYLIPLASFFVSGFSFGSFFLSGYSFGSFFLSGFFSLVKIFSLIYQSYLSVGILFSFYRSYLSFLSVYVIV